MIQKASMKKNNCNINLNKCQSPWMFNGKEFTEDMVDKYEGFCYIITHISSGIKYIGKKCFWQRRKTPKSKKRIKSPSDWQSYWSSSEELKEWVKREGEDKFKREIIAICKTTGEVNYLELYLIISTRALETDKYLNENILGKYFKKNIMKYDSLKNIQI